MTCKTVKPPVPGNLAPVERMLGGELERIIGATEAPYRPRGKIYVHVPVDAPAEDHRLANLVNEAPQSAATIRHDGETYVVETSGHDQFNFRIPDGTTWQLYPRTRSLAAPIKRYWLHGNGEAEVRITYLDEPGHVDF